MGDVHAALIVNPATRLAGSAVREVTLACAVQGWQPPLVLMTTAEEPGAAQTAQALAQGVDRVIVAGGDGTVRHVAGALASVAGGANPVPLAVVPVGAANLVARNLGLKTGRLDDASQIALTGWPHLLSVGWVACLRDGTWGDDLPMVAVAGIGRDAEAIAAIRPSLKQLAGWLAYAEAGGRQALRPSMPMTVVMDDGDAEDVSAWSVLVANLPRLPLGIVAFPDVQPGNETMQVLQVQLRHPGQWGAVAVKGIGHTSGDVPALRYSSANWVSVRTGHALPVQIDGDLLPAAHAMRVRLQRHAIQVMMPNE